MEKIVLFQDIDGVLNTFRGEEHLHPDPKKHQWISPPLGAEEYFRFVLDHFDVVLMSGWCAGSFSLPKSRVAEFCWLTKITPDEVKRLPSMPFWPEKPDGIEWFLKQYPEREWLWVEDERSVPHATWLEETNNWHRFLHVDALENPAALLDTALPLLRERLAEYEATGRLLPEQPRSPGTAGQPQP